MDNNAVKYEVGDDGIALVYIDIPEKTGNIINKDFMKRFYLVLTGIRDDREVRGVILYSMKKDSFLEYYDLKELREIKSKTKAMQLSRFGQKVTKTLENLPFPTIAAIHGRTCGAGLEIALACDYRISTFSLNTIFRLPQIQVGLLPFMGGTQRLPKLVGLKNALDMMLTGRVISSEQAAAIGLVEINVHHKDLMKVAKNRILELLSKTKKNSYFYNLKEIIHHYDFSAVTSAFEEIDVIRLLTDRTIIGRYLLNYFKIHKFKSDALKKYQAILMIKEACGKAFSISKARGMAYETSSFSELLQNKITRNLIFLYTLKDEFVEEQRNLNGEMKDFSKSNVFIIGAGELSGNIAAIIASSGIRIRIKDNDPSRISKGLKAARDLLNQKVRTGDLSPESVGESMKKISTTLDYSGIRQADFIIEALNEKLDLKTDMLTEIEPLLKNEAIVCTTTSVLPYHNLSTASGRADRFIGVHFIPPLNKNPLIEVPYNIKTTKETIQTTKKFIEYINKIPFVLKDTPGYLINRILAPYLIEAVILMEEGIPAEKIEQIMQNFGMESGPLRILDELGIDNALAIGQILFFQFGERFRLPHSMKTIIANKRFGKKNQCGFYSYSSEGRAVEIDNSVNKLFKQFSTYKKSISNKQIEQRMLFMLLNETVRCVEEKILLPIHHIDLALVFAKFFPAFLGGPLRYIDSIGAHNLAKEMDLLADLYGERFEPTPLLTEYSTKKMRFYQRKK